MAAKNREELLAITVKEFEKLSALIAEIDDASAMRKREEDTSIKDVIAHRAHWIGLFLGWYKDGLAGKEVFFPAKGYKWNQLKAFNAALREKQVDVSWALACRRLKAKHKALTKFMGAQSNKVLYGGPMKGANNHWTPGRWAEAAGPSHYRSAAKYIRACRRDDAS